MEVETTSAEVQALREKVTKMMHENTRLQESIEDLKQDHETQDGEWNQQKLVCDGPLSPGRR